MGGLSEVIVEAESWVRGRDWIVRGLEAVGFGSGVAGIEKGKDVMDSLSSSWIKSRASSLKSSS